MSTAPVIELEHVSFAYDGAPVLRDVTFAIEERQFVSVIGPNGGGKTTLLKILLGLLTPTKGQVRIFGKRPADARLHVGYFPQNAQLDPTFPANVLDVVLMGRLGHTSTLGPYRTDDRTAAMSALRQVALDGVAGRPLASLSGGQRQRVLIARALACDPHLLLLDEPTANLDVRIESEFYDVLRKLNDRLTIVLVSHDIGVVSQLVQRVVCVNRTVQVHPTVEFTGEVIREMYGGEFRMVRHDHHH